MSNPIFEDVEHELGVVINHGEADVKLVWQHITGRKHPQHYDPASNPEETTMSALADVETWLAEAEKHRTVIHDAATALDRYSQSKIVTELEALTQPLDPGLETLVAGMIRTAGAAAAKVAELTEPDAPAEPSAPGDPQIQTGIAV